MTDRDQFIIETLTQTKSNIQSADKKASTLLAGQFAFLGLFANVVAPVWDDGGSAFHYLTALALLGALGSILAAAIVVFPREGDRNLLYFSEIADKDRETYVKEVISLDAEGRSKELLRCDYAISTIADRKHTYVRLSVVGAILAVFFGTAALMISAL